MVLFPRETCDAAGKVSTQGLVQSKIFGTENGEVVARRIADEPQTNRDASRTRCSCHGCVSV